MGFDIGKVEIESLPRPQGLAYEFIKKLACEASCVGEGNALGFYQRSDMETSAKEFAEGNELAEAILADWIETLPWDEDSCLTLHFSW